MSEWESFAERKRDGTVRRYDTPCDSERDELERGWTVRGFTRHFSVADFDAHSVGYFVAAGMIQKNWMVSTLVHASCSRRANWWGDCDAQQSSCISKGTDKRELLGERADGLQSSWVDS